MADWGYSKCNGPHTWANNVEAARGKHQSPINIRGAEVQYDAQLKANPLSISYQPGNARKLLNNGFSIQVTYDSKDSALEGGPLKTSHQVAQFHFHWGSSDKTGAEHHVDGKVYAAEGHIVHFNAEKYGTFADSADKPDGLAVLGFFIKEGKEHEGMKKLTDKFSSVSHKGDSIDMESFDPACLLPADRERYWTYNGSLTTPPCYESVQFIIFKEPVEVSAEQLNQFRSLLTYAKGQSAPSDELHGQMVENYRPCMDLNDRVVRASFDGE